ncbi:hypothetical protein JSQ81_05980 [Sporosarcina sp. Marseille-Q4063]|uniref:hypothetical protein n=1 Tax=Sporosarcina sp. Marseille-Q4063 TaxID=2810514 RepID=UPI001BAFAA5F|nr:hypothetical protein [Sporosarcina sp. Marseille-Q4063]QUW23114.1 hypothetical protein JSQ81_05980 [Sporosarcina sp. Marseille-Q4063]
MESPTTKEAFEEIERLSQNPETRRLADFRKQELIDILQRFEDGVAQGRKKLKRDVVFRMNAAGIAPEKVAEYVGLPTDYVSEIIKSIEK